MMYYKQLDALRCYSVLWVLLNHLPIFSLPPSLKSFFNFLPGVQLFFCISGFLITGIVLQNRNSEKKNFLKSFYARRFLRIFPIYYLVIFFLFIINVGDYRSTWFIYDFFYVSNIKLGLLGGFEYNTVSPHFWSLAVEEQFYLFLPGLLLLFNGKTRSYAVVWLLFGMGAILSVFYGSFFIYRTLGCLSYLGSGCVLAVAFHYNQGAILKKEKQIGILFVITLLLLILISCYKFSISPTMELFITILVVPVFVLKFILGFHSKIAKVVLENKIIVYLGKISYGIYVYHMFALYPIVIIQKLTGTSLFEEQGMASLCKIFITIIISMISWEFFEKRLNTLKHKFAYKAINQN